MCNLCDEKTGEQSHCQDCGRMICFDNEPDNIDVIDQAYVTASGDRHCRRCGSSYDQVEEGYEYDDEPYWDEYAIWRG